MNHQNLLLQDDPFAAPDSLDCLPSHHCAPQEKNHPSCKGKNCGATDGLGHSAECFAEHEACVSGIFDPLDTPGNKNPEYRYAGYSGAPCGEVATDDQRKAWQEGRNASSQHCAPEIDPRFAAAHYGNDLKPMEESPPVDGSQIVATPEECWSANNEEFNCLTLGDLMDENEELKVGDTVYVGESRKPSSAELCDADDILEMMGDRASDIAGEYAEDYPDVTNAAKADLDDFLKAWIEKHASPSFYTVSNARPYILSVDDFESCEVPT